MGDKESSIPFSNITLGMFEDGTFVPLGNVVPSSVAFDEGIEDEPEDAIITHCKPGSLSFSASVDSVDGLDEFYKDIASIEDIRAVMLSKEEHIYRPKNLKYPNKKRAKRIWKKWKTRYGYSPKTELRIPKSKFTTTAIGDGFEVNITAINE